jgi:hypothetical protein
MMYTLEAGKVHFSRKMAALRSMVRTWQDVVVTLGAA